MSIESVPMIRNKEDEAAISEVNSDTFGRYLLQPSYSFDVSLKFADRLTLTQFSPHLAELALHEPEIHYYPEELRQYLNGMQDEKAKRLAEVKVVPERQRIISFNLRTNEIESSEIKEGEYSNVEYSLSDFFARDNIHPLASAHTHPKNHLFSIQDYLPNLIDLEEAYGFPHRLVKASFVINPDGILLALATPQTPMYKFDVAHAVVRRWNDSSESVLEPEKDAYADSLNQLSALQENTIEEIIRTKDVFTHRVKNGEISQTESELEQKNFLAELLSSFERDIKVMNNRSIELFTLLRTTGAYNYNFWNMQFARAMNFKLYSSSDFEHYEAFSA